MIRLNDIQDAGGGEHEFEAFDGKLQALYTPGLQKLTKNMDLDEVDVHMYDTSPAFARAAGGGRVA